MGWSRCLLDIFIHVVEDLVKKKNKAKKPHLKQTSLQGLFCFHSSIPAHLTNHRYDVVVFLS